MDFNITKDNELPYYQIELSGQFDLQDLERCYREMINHPNWVSGLNILWDARECDVDHLQSDDLEDIGKMTTKYRGQRGAGSAAWVVSRDIDFGIARMFEMLNKSKVIFTFCVFNTISEAQKYVLYN